MNLGKLLTVSVGNIQLGGSAVQLVYKAVSYIPVYQDPSLLPFSTTKHMARPNLFGFPDPTSHAETVAPWHYVI